MSESKQCRCQVPRPDGEGLCSRCWKEMGVYARDRLRRLEQAEARVEATLRKMGGSW